jgi:hypothetical protein
MELGQLLTRSGLTYPEVFSKVCHDSFIYYQLIEICHYSWQYLKLYVQLCAPDDGRKNRLKHVERL